ncbi:MAG: OB-fold domain-containing protein, partial [Halodesulfurarchaeum sp.]|nr:OB-fold domain-containing protein [Halodesulfurarchaeum sp.]
MPELAPIFENTTCADCGLVFHYPRAHCPDCLGDAVEWREAAGTGEVYTYSVARTLSGWPEEDLPLVVAYVELEEGPRVLTNVRADPDDVAVGTRVAVTFVETAEPDVAIPVFEPAQDTADT